MNEPKRNHSKNAAGLATRLLLGVFCLTSALPLTAATIFDNSVNDAHTGFQFGSMETGDEIQLAGTARYLTNFSCGYELLGNQPESHVTARLRFYLNDGPPPRFDSYATPGTILYDTDWFAVAPATRGTLVLSAGLQFPMEGLFLPASDITWSIQFQGLASGEAAGVQIYSPPMVGADAPYCWAAESGVGWVRQIDPHGGAMDFKATLEATEVPEPSSLALALSTFGALVIWLTGPTRLLPFHIGLLWRGANEFCRWPSALRRAQLGRKYEETNE